MIFVSAVHRHLVYKTIPWFSFKLIDFGIINDVRTDDSVNKSLKDSGRKDKCDIKKASSCRVDSIPDCEDQLCA